MRTSNEVQNGSNTNIISSQETTDWTSEGDGYSDPPTSQEATDWATESNSYPESSDVETVTLEEANEWSSEVELNSYPAPIRSDDYSQEGTTEWYYESYSDGESYEWSWWEETTGGIEHGVITPCFTSLFYSLNSAPTEIPK